MTESEKMIKSYEDAIDCLKKNKPTSGFYMLQESVDMAIKALEEIQQYRAIGTVEECRAAVEKQTAKLVINNTPTEDGVWYQCPTCKGDLTSIRGFYCCHCGQKLDWSDEE